MATSEKAKGTICIVASLNFGWILFGFLAFVALCFIYLFIYLLSYSISHYYLMTFMFSRP